MEDFYQFDEEFRDSIATVDEKGKRIWVYPKKPKGKYHNRRIAVTVVLLSILFAGPFLKINGQPFLLLNIFERKFVILGTPFWPQDFLILALMAITFFVFIILFTVIFGRLWCGWACPQTLFMEMVFRKIEYWIEGDANQQRKLDASAWDFNKVWRKGLKHLIFVAFSILISHTVMAYLIGIENVKELISQPPGENLSGFMGLVFFTAVFYWVFAYFREQACTVVCPYGRLQGALLNEKSIVVGYDFNRGEPRGKIKKDQDADTQGDCIDCKLCVHACPTGIDIRHGTQLECVHCTACIDACDEVMLKIDKPTGLIRYASYEGLKDGVSKIFNSRVAAYSIVLAVLVTLLASFIATRSEVEATVLKARGTLFTEEPDGRISNLYNAQVINKTFDDLTLKMKLDNFPDGSIKLIGNQEMFIEANSMIEVVFFIKLPKEAMDERFVDVELGFYTKEGELKQSVETNFMGPRK